MKTRSNSRIRPNFTFRSKLFSRRQRGGNYTGGYGNYSFTGPAGVSAGGVPFDSRAADNGNCGWTLRPAPQLGGRKQRGGGGGTGGHGFELNNSLGKVYASLPVGPCPAAPVATQLGGASDHELLGLQSYPSGYSLGRAVSTDSAHYLDPVRYDRSCMGGGARKRTHKRNRNRVRRFRF
jgi:hypothetical protein